MKTKIRLFLLFSIVIALVLSLTACATSIDVEELRVYIEEKLVPILMGVATSVIALLGTLKSIYKSLTQMKESKEAFDTSQKKIEENSRSELNAIKNKYEDIKASIKDVPQLDGKIKELREQTDTLVMEIANLSKIISIGFAESKELVKDGKAREIVLLANKNQEMIENETT